MKKHFEILLIRLAAFIIDRNVQRAMYISRRDNNFLFEARYRLLEIAERMGRDYVEPEK